ADRADQFSLRIVNFNHVARLSDDIEQPGFVDCESARALIDLKGLRRLAGSLIDLDDLTRLDAEQFSLRIERQAMIDFARQFSHDLARLPVANFDPLMDTRVDGRFPAEIRNC